MSDRSPNTDALATLGTVITSAEKRDAIHLAVIATCASDRLMPGSHVGVNGKFSSRENLIGIVDPFLTSPVEAGEWFWLIIYPRKITSLRHVWSHPDVPEEEDYITPPGEDQVIIGPNPISVQYLEAAAANLGTSYDDLMDMIDEYVSKGYAPCFGHDINYDVDSRAVLMHYTVVRSATVTHEQQENFYFRCAC